MMGFLFFTSYVSTQFYATRLKTKRYQLESHNFFLCFVLNKQFLDFLKQF